MNLLKPFRKSSLIYLSSLLFFVVSCTQYEPIKNAQREMDYSLHQLYKSQPQLNIDYISIQIQNKSTEELSQALLDIVNEANGTNISLPEVVLILL